MPARAQPDASSPQTTPAATGRPGSPNNPGMPDKANRERPVQVSSSLAPIKAEKFGYAEARHLLWRAGFGGSPSQIRTVAGWGPAKAVNHLVDYQEVAVEPIAADAFDPDIMRPLNAEERGEIAKARRSGDEESVARLRAQRQEAERTDREQMLRIGHWWLKRMIETPRPLEEKMTLFWHGHFATSYRTIEDSYHMFMQNQLFRRHAVGNYGKLLYEIIRDPAMIAYLDNNDSRKGKPNENLARELMELFSLGVGNYTEQDIKEGARALTGFTYEDDEFVFQRGNHDDGPKKILGRSGRLDGDGFVSAILETSACSRYIARKLYRFFVADLPSGRTELDKAADSVVRQLASALVSAKYELKPVLKKLFASEHFYDINIQNEMIKSPAELVVGAVRSFNPPVRDLGVLGDAMKLMGQQIFNPPSVKGWDGGRSWINTATLFIRQNILCFMLTGKTPQGYDALANKEAFDAEQFRDALLAAGESPIDVPDGRSDADRFIDELLRFALGAPTRGNRKALADYLGSRARIDGEAVTHALLLVTAMPEYQLC